VNPRLGVLGVPVWLAEGGGDGANLVGLLSPGVLIALFVAAAVLLVVAAITGWLIWRRVRRSGIIARGRMAAQRGLLAVGAQALPEGPRRDLAGLQAQVSQSRAELARQVASADASGGYLGDLPRVLPRLDADGLRLERALAALVFSGDEQRIARDQPHIAASARAYIDAAGRALAALGTSQAAGRGPQMARLYGDVDDAVAGLNAYSDAYRELGGGTN
jgi:hypothetical protein